MYNINNWQVRYNSLLNTVLYNENARNDGIKNSILMEALWHDTSSGVADKNGALTVLTLLGKRILLQELQTCRYCCTYRKQNFEMKNEALVLWNRVKHIRKLSFLDQNNVVIPNNSDIFIQFHNTIYLYRFQSPFTQSSMHTLCNLVTEVQ
jgi:hypothetical protein